jgi:hypothetical protein
MSRRARRARTSADACEISISDLSLIVRRGRGDLGPEWIEQIEELPRARAEAIEVGLAPSAALHQRLRMGLPQDVDNLHRGRRVAEGSQRGLAASRASTTGKTLSPLKRLIAQWVKDAEAKEQLDNCALWRLVESRLDADARYPLGDGSFLEVVSYPEAALGATLRKNIELEQEPLVYDVRRGEDAPPKRDRVKLDTVWRMVSDARRAAQKNKTATV